MINKQISIQNLLLQEDRSTVNQNTNRKVQEIKTDEYPLEVENQNLSVMPPKIYFFKSMTRKESSQINNNNDINSNILDSQMNTNFLNENKAFPTTNSIKNNFEISIPNNSQLPSYPTLLPSPITQHQFQTNPTAIPQKSVSLKIPETYKSNSRIRWTKQEDEQLMSLVRKWGARKWNEIAASLATKTAKQCRDHYANCLDPEIKNSLWTVEEEQILLLKYEQLGPHWSRIKSFLPGRTTSMIKNYITMLLKKNGKEVSNNSQSNKEKHESSASSANSCSENEEHENYYNNNMMSNEMQEKKDGFAIHDINFLLNRPATFTGQL